MQTSFNSSEAQIYQRCTPRVYHKSPVQFARLKLPRTKNQAQTEHRIKANFELSDFEKSLFGLIYELYYFEFLQFFEFSARFGGQLVFYTGRVSIEKGNYQRHLPRILCKV